MLSKKELKKMNMVLKKSTSFRPVVLKDSSNRIKSKLSVREIESILGIDRIELIRITSADSKDMENDLDYFKGWYEDELRKFFQD
ncbi:hypothetical protein D3C76_361010 [compost metagenome]